MEYVNTIELQNKEYFKQLVFTEGQRITDIAYMNNFNKFLVTEKTISVIIKIRWS